MRSALFIFTTLLIISCSNRVEKQSEKLIKIYLEHAILMKENKLITMEQRYHENPLKMEKWYNLSQKIDGRVSDFQKMDIDNSNASLMLEKEYYKIIDSLHSFAVNNEIPIDSKLFEKSNMVNSKLFMTMNIILIENLCLDLMIGKSGSISFYDSNFRNIEN
jgi:hypothetical protein